MWSAAKQRDHEVAKGTQQKKVVSGREFVSASLSKMQRHGHCQFVFPRGKCLENRGALVDGKKEQGKPLRERDARASERFLKGFQMGEAEDGTPEMEVWRKIL